MKNFDLRKLTLSNDIFKKIENTFYLGDLDTVIWAHMWVNLCKHLETHLIKNIKINLFTTVGEIKNECKF